MPLQARPLRTRPYLTVGALILAVAVVYFVAAELGLRLALIRGQVTPLWPPTGIALACLLLFGVRCWPGVTIGAFVANILVGPTFPAVVMISAGNTIGPLVACFLLTRVGFRTDLLRLRDALALVFIAAFGGMLISATIGTWTLYLAGVLPASDVLATWSVWWTGDAMGVLVIAPLLLVAATRHWHWRVPASRWLEAGVLLLCVVVVTVVVTRASANLLFLIFPVLIWAALRFQLAGAVSCNLVVTVAAVLAAEARLGPFADFNLLSTMITLQAFNGSATLTALLLAAITSERNEAQHSLQRAATQLSDAVRMLEPYSLLNRGLFQRVLREREPHEAPRAEPGG